ncbi:MULTISPECIES: shikimate dehydrogenase family protein [Tenebrionibacter/Tenebrionicola group]|jgi:shikimate dehydrogenase|uniref:Shikimate dehydrogenase n=2 Tax=Tenebrionibacter/Tenebrionicola group TaxID=2969848 RepID=A0A8K0V201_9ENTR|nr:MULTISPECIES: shikimate dehydrogenase [Tenebrionibacter/Tenebrionicola group]MBK4715552.1 shikimate dehydrogenase [Tenebrionibacter intestinalis]MBV5095795.1 shikimate dehydrogenase [Tenebrionicola larvae]
MAIDGSTRVIAHLGWPTESFKAPLIYNPWFASQHENIKVVPLGVKAEAYPTLLAGLFSATNVIGALITMPHKVTTCELVSTLSPTAQIAGACNAVRAGEDGRLHGDMFDGEGFVRGMLQRGQPARGARALVIGSGGVGSAIAASLAAAGVASLTLFDTRARISEALAARLRAHYPQLEVQTGNRRPGGHDIVVNATPLGMNPGDPLPLEVAQLTPGTFVGEVVMKQAITPFLSAARERGCVIQQGLDMLFEMIPAYLSFFGLPTTSAENLRRVAKID